MPPINICNPHLQSGPHDHMEPLNSQTLTIALLHLREMTTLPADPFTNAPKLTVIDISDTPLQELAANVFL